MNVERVCIVGLGLIGGSFGLALRLAQRTAIPRFPLHITVVDADPETRRVASRLADVVTADFAAGVRQADLVVLATPVRVIIQLLQKLPQVRPEGCLVLDLGSSKAEICAAMDRLPPQFGAIGGHPMAGREVGGFGAATPDLFQESTFILCETARTTTAVRALAAQIVTYLRARPLFLPAATHDAIVAVASHLPYLVAATLMGTGAEMDEPLLWPISATGFRDTVRVAGTDPQMMLDILLTNRAAVLEQISAYQSRMTAVAAHIAQEDETALLHWLQTAQAAHRHYRTEKLAALHDSKGEEG